MKKYNLILLLTLFYTHQIGAQIINWEKTYGGSSNENAMSIVETTSGDFIIAGFTNSSNNNVIGQHGLSDVWVISINSNGTLIWQKCFGGTLDDLSNKIIATNDGNFILIGSTESNNGDISGLHGGKDVLVIKFDGNGNIIWQKCFGGTLDDYGTAINETTGNEYVITGSSKSNNGDVTGNNGQSDIWVFKIDNSGNLIWENNYGGSSLDDAHSIISSPNGNIYILGRTYSNDLDITNNHGGSDIILLKLNNSGLLLWQKCLGGSDFDWPYGQNGLALNGNTKLYLIGSTQSNDGDVIGNHNTLYPDGWLVSLDTNGNIINSKCFGGSATDGFSSLIYESNYLTMVGYSKSSDGDLNNVAGGPDINFGDLWLLKTDELFNIVTNNLIGGTYSEEAFDIINSSNGKNIICGRTESCDIDISNCLGADDFWVIETNDLLNIKDIKFKESINIFPNPTNQFITIENTLGLENNYEVSLYDISGLQVINKKIYNGSIDVSSLSSGSYLMKIEVDGNVVHKMVQVMK